MQRMENERVVNMDGLLMPAALSKGRAGRQPRATCGSPRCDAVACRSDATRSVPGRYHRRRVRGLVFLLLLASIAHAAEPAATEVQRARAHFEAGSGLYQLGRYDEAIA